MSRPHVTIHAMLSADGRTDHLAGDVGLYYELAARLPQDAVLSGSETFLAAASAQGIAIEGEDPMPAAALGAAAGTSAPQPVEGPSGPGDDGFSRPLVVIVDSRGRLTRFDWLRAMPYWRDVVVACSAATPAAHLELLARHAIRHHVVGDAHVDLGRLLELLEEGDGVRHVRVDSGGVLNGALLRAGLVDEISLLVAPLATGGRSPAALFVADDLMGERPAQLELRSVERLRGDNVWLRYRVVPEASM